MHLHGQQVSSGSLRGRWWRLSYTDWEIQLVVFTQLCPTLCDPMDCGPPGSSVHGILQPRILQWVAMPFSRGSSQPKDRTQVSHTAGGFFTTEPSGNPMNTGVDSYPFSRGSSWPRNWTGVSCIASGFFTSWATREAHEAIKCPTSVFLWEGKPLWTSVEVYS